MQILLIAAPAKVYHRNVSTVMSLSLLAYNNKEKQEATIMW